ncbi:hypothetical protein BpHYR1_050405 [Brachionus plicatilis]|uniref:Uncharacterized protein n=1 Tax=Brachionus plicatilis TaxID=10195 RepID=A0A3M7SBR4_BRAPC|nr:hypothetical protein BpHYR1_050405 [Brachionus plicatilis]
MKCRAKFLLHSSDEAVTQTENRISNADPKGDDEKFETSSDGEVVEEENGETGVEVGELVNVQEGNKQRFSKRGRKPGSKSVRILNRKNKRRRLEESLCRLND